MKSLANETTKGSDKMPGMSKAKKKGIVSWILWIVLFLGIFSVAGWYWGADTLFSVASPAADKIQVEAHLEGGIFLPPGVGQERFGESATLYITAFDQESATKAQVEVTNYLWISKWDTTEGVYGDYVYSGSATIASTGTTSVTGATIGDMVKIIGFDSTYDYGIEQNFVVTKSSETKPLKVHKGTATQTITFYDENGDAVTNTTSGVTVGSTSYIMDKIRVTNTDDYSEWKPYLIGFDYPEVTNVTSIRVSGATEFTGGFKRLKTVDDWYYLNTAVEAESLNNDKTRIDTGTVTITPDGDAVTAETLTVYVVDLAPYLDNDNALRYGYQSDAVNPTDLGVTDKSQTITLA